MRKLQTILATALCLSLVSCGGPITRTGKESYKSQGEKIEDTKVIRFVKEKFRSDPLIPHDLIHVAIDRKVVQLSGFVDDEQQAHLALVNVQNSPGVGYVINNLVVRSSVAYAKVRADMERFGGGTSNMGSTFAPR